MIKNVSKKHDLGLLFNQEFNFISDLLDNVNLPSEKSDDSGKSLLLNLISAINYSKHKSQSTFNYVAWWEFRNVFYYFRDFMKFTPNCRVYPEMTISVFSLICIRSILYKNTVIINLWFEWKIRSSWRYFRPFSSHVGFC